MLVVRAAKADEVLAHLVRVRVRVRVRVNPNPNAKADEVLAHLDGVGAERLLVRARDRAR